MKRVALLVGVLLLLPLMVWADTIRFKNGSTSKGKLIKRTATEIVVELEGLGTATFTPDEIAAIEPDAAIQTDHAEETVPPTADVPTETHEAAASAPLDATAVPAGALPQAPAPSSREIDAMAAMRAVALVVARQPDGKLAAGSGTVISPKGVLVTCAHLVQGAEVVKVVLMPNPAAGRTNPKSYSARVLKTDACYDLALLNIATKTPDYLSFAPEDTVVAGMPVRAIGNPQGLSISVSTGSIRAIKNMKESGAEAAALTQHPSPECAHLSTQALEAFTLIHTNAELNPPNLGGPLLNARNELVGMNLVSAQGAEAIGLAVHVKHLRKFSGSYAKR